MSLPAGTTLGPYEIQSPLGPLHLALNGDTPYCRLLTATPRIGE